MKALTVPKTAIYLLTAIVLMLPAAAQNEQADPHAHDWMKEQALPKLKQEQATAEAQTPATATTPTTEAPKSPAVDVLNQSLGGVNSSYHGAHTFYKDDQVAPIVVAVIAVLVVLGFALYTARTKKKD